MNITMMRDTLRCPQLAYNLHITRRGPLHTPRALELGTLFHEAMELRMRNEEVQYYTLPSWAEVSQETRDLFVKHELYTPLNAFAPDPNWEIHGVEMKVERPITQSLILEGTLDGFIIWQGKLWDVQWKTYTDNLLELLEKVRLSWHEVGYQWMAEPRISLPWGGTILGACQKLPGYRMTEGPDGKRHRETVTDGMREKAFSLHFITRAPEQQDAMVGQLIQAAMGAQASLEWSSPIPRNYDQCFGRFGTSRCPFFKVCHEGESLAGPDFRDMENRYAQGSEAT